MRQWGLCISIIGRADNKRRRHEATSQTLYLRNNYKRFQISRRVHENSQSEVKAINPTGPYRHIFPKYLNGSSSRELCESMVSKPEKLGTAQRVPTVGVTRVAGHGCVL